MVVSFGCTRNPFFLIIFVIASEKSNFFIFLDIFVGLHLDLSTSYVSFDPKMTNFFFLVKIFILYIILFKISRRLKIKLEHITLLYLFLS